MNIISLTKTHVTASGSVHAQIKINNNDVGLLYLTPHEIDVLTNALRDGLLNSNTALETDLFDEEYSEEDLY